MKRKARLATLVALTLSCTGDPSEPSGLGAVVTAPPGVGVRGDVSVADVQFNQAAQAGDGSVPIVLGGNGVVVNVVLRAAPATAQRMQVVLRLFNAAGVLTRADTVRTNGTVGGSSTLAAPSVQFLLPSSALSAGMRWQVVRDPRGLTPDDAASNDVFPRSGVTAVSTVAVPPLRVKFVPIVLTAHSNVAGAVSAATVPNYLRLVESVHPLGAIEASVTAPMTTSIPFGTGRTGGSSASFWGPLLAQIDMARLADPDPSTYYVGVVRPPPGFDSVASGGMGYIPSSGQSFGPGTRTSAVISDGWANYQAFTREAVAHELGHNFGRRHAPCGNASSADPAFPYDGGVIGNPGYDVRSWVNGRAVHATSLPPSTGDIMGYCRPGWVSDYTYRGVMAFRGSASAALGAQARAMSIKVSRSLIVRGIVSDDEGVAIEPAFTIDARAVQPERRGNYRLEGRAADGRVLFSYAFEPAALDHSSDIGHFAFAVPLTPSTEADLATLEVRGPRGMARIARPSGARAALRTPGNATARIAGGVVTASCSDANARGILVRDGRSGALLGTAAASSVGVVVSAGTPIDVACSDGIGSATTAVMAR